jgi:membrane dipeptidase
MITWEAHTCLPLDPKADLAPLERYRAAGVAYVSVNVGMDMTPVPRIIEVIAGFRSRIAAHPDRFVNNSVADGCHDVERGLTPLGRRIVAAINDAGVLLDCSHTGRRCSLDIMAASTAPVVFSHSKPGALVDHGRNITDEPGLSGVSMSAVDRDYWWPRSAGYEDAIATMRYAPLESWLQLAEELKLTGMTAGEAALVMGGNMARVASEVWRAPVLGR